MDERRIVVAVDESEESMYALSWCLNNLLSQSICNTTLVLLYVKPPPPVFSSIDTTGYLFDSDAFATLQKYGKKLANSVMNKAETVYRNFNPNVCPSA
ncbi:unnamed protein product [Ilex paraguariensis]|uniref:UspA domain-containing protein n=1 Tax=Ilex paraguariensis TaxID=185542 RepID=A0ABC8RKX4_9AQUA